MKFATTALAIVFLAHAVPALAQRDEVERAEPADAPSAERSFEPPANAPPSGPSRDGSGRRDDPRDDVGPSERYGPRGREVPPAPVATDAPQARPAPSLRDGGGRGRSGGWVPGNSVGRPGPWILNRDGDADPQGNGATRWDDRADRGGNPDRGSPGDQARGPRDEERGDRRYQRDDRRNEGRYDRDRRHGDRRDSRGDDRYDRYSYWQRGRYPSVYFSSSRYRYPWRPPSGYYAYNWGFGDFLPRQWYGPGSGLMDPWRYDLPLPPPGYDWVRVGYDAVLVDQFTGRVVQVVRNIFW